MGEGYPFDLHQQLRSTNIAYYIDRRQFAQSCSANRPYSVIFFLSLDVDPGHGEVVERCPQTA